MKGDVVSPTNVEKVHIVYGFLSFNRYTSMDEIIDKYRVKTGIKAPRADVKYALDTLLLLKVIEAESLPRPGSSGLSEKNYRIRKELPKDLGRICGDSLENTVAT